ncbi:TPA: CPXCG motif-containing cysteine-rich protein [Aeromonas hydrophila]
MGCCRYCPTDSTTTEMSHNPSKYAIPPCMACCNPIHLRLHRDEARDCLQLFVDADDEQMF